MTKTVTNFIALSAALASLSLAVTAQAQMTANFRTYGDRAAPGTMSNLYFTTWPVSAAECAANTLIPVQISMAPPVVVGTNLFFDVWAGGTGATLSVDCKPGTNRRAVGSTAAVCTHVWAGPRQGGVMQLLEIPPQSLFGSDCSMSGDRWFHIMLVGATGDTSADIAAANVVNVRVVFDGTAPSAPTNVSTSAGDTSIEVTWTLASDQYSSARVYVDPTGTCGGGSTTDSGTTVDTGVSTDAGTDVDAGDMDAGDVSDAGDVADAGAPSDAGEGADAGVDVDAGGGSGGGGLVQVAVVEGTSPSSAIINGSTIEGFDTGDSLPVYVVVYDTARNVSTMSEAGCIRRVEVDGFWSTYCEGRYDSLEECRAAYSGCSASPGGRGSAAPLAGLSLLLLGLVARRVKKRNP